MCIIYQLIACFLPSTASDCFEIGRLSYNENDFYHTTLWMQQAIDLLANDSSRWSERVETLDYLAFSYYKVFQYTAFTRTFNGARRVEISLLELVKSPLRTSSTEQMNRKKHCMKWVIVILWLKIERIKYLK